MNKVNRTSASQITTLMMMTALAVFIWLNAFAEQGTLIASAA